MRSFGVTSPTEIRNPTTNPARVVARHAASVSRRNRSRRVSSPPHASSRRFVRGLRNCDGRYPCDATTSTPSMPARSSRAAAAPNPATISSISAAGIARGITWNRSVGTADGAQATASVPSAVSMISRPPWNSCPNTVAPWRWMTSASRAKPGIASSVSAVSSDEV